MPGSSGDVPRPLEEGLCVLAIVLFCFKFILILEAQEQQELLLDKDDHIGMLMDHLGGYRRRVTWFHHK